MRGVPPLNRSQETVSGFGRDDGLEMEPTHREGTGKEWASGDARELGLQP